MGNTDQNLHRFLTPLLRLTQIFAFVLKEGYPTYHLCVQCFSQLSFDSEMYTKSATADDFVYISETNESCEKHSTQR